MHKQWLKWLLPVLAFLVAFGLGRLDSRLYRQPIGQVIAVKTVKSVKTVDNFDNQDRTTTQEATVRFLNTSRRGQTTTITNQFTYSGTVDSPLRHGTQVFLTKSSGPWRLSNFKRDAIVLALAAFTLALLMLIVRKRLWLISASIAVNAILFTLATHIQTDASRPLVWVLFSGLAIVFAVVTALFVVGWRPVCAVVVGGTVGATALAVGLGYAIFALTGYRDLHLEAVKYVTQSPQLLFFIQIVIGSLGAVLDECSDIAISIMQLDGSGKKRFNAGMAIGRNVMGPLITVLFMIFIAETFAEAVLWLRNGNAIDQTISWVMGLGFAQSLISGFGIVIAIPLTSLLATLAGKKEVAA
ncbi:YibE/F family protein [Lacticaseibacillus mingshuiensis]|uniref:YibE/F family protein n=1 Tax=Lacticaseibacillus mingshuiensis TaxID=2799574 RepID=UPI0019504F78|nr:YibE/F family protein [Lacticaseibacillus mingshuiensis]